MNIINKMWLSLTVLLLAAWTCLADEKMQSFSSASRLSPRQKRMVGGTLAPHVPWQVMVYISDNVMDGGYAGGALISDRWVLTAGRNVFVRKSRQDTQGKNPVIPKVYLGITRREEANASTEVAVEKIVLHPGFQNHTDWDNDLALIQLKEPVVVNDKVTPIPLPQSKDDPGEITDGAGFITGWGWGVHLTPAQSLKCLKIFLTSNYNCEATYRGNNLAPNVDDNMLCAETMWEGENVCFGDAGGALVVTDSKTGYIYAAGILSYDKGCRRDRNTVYLKISSYLPWIHSVIRGDTEKSSAVRAAAMAKMFSRQQ